MNPERKLSKRIAKALDACNLVRPDELTAVEFVIAATLHEIEIEKGKPK